MVAPMIAAAGIGALGSALGGVLGGKGQKKAAKQAAQSQAQTTAANNALVQWNYNQNAARLDPYAAGGTRAGNVLQELLLGPAPTATAAPAQGTQQYGSALSPYTGGAAPQIAPNVLAMQNDGIKGNFARAIQSQYPDMYAMYSGNLNNGTAGDFASAVTGGGMGAPTYNAGAGTATGATSNTTGAPVSALSAWDQFRNGTNYQWRLGEGQRAINQGYAGAGALDSGAAQLALMEHGQNFASNELGNWMNMLAGQQSVGMSAASSLAGVGNTATGAMMGNNQAMSDANANRALIGGQANANMWGGIAQGIGQVAGAWGSSYSNPQTMPAQPGGAMNFNLPTTYNYGY